MTLERIVQVTPKKFVDSGPKVSSNRNWRAIVKYEHTIMDVMVKSPVTMSGIIVTEVSGHDPDVDLWFQIKCRNFYGAEFWLVTDGDNWMFYDHVKHRLSNESKRGKSIDLDKLNLIDQEIIQLAISYYIEDGGNANFNASPQPGQTSSNKTRNTIRI